MGHKIQAKRLTEGSLRKFLPSAMISAGKEVIKVSGKWLSPWEGAEYQYGVHIANKLYNAYSCSVLCEYLASDTIKDARPRKREFGDLTDLKTDLTVLNDRGRIIAMVEVKRCVWQYKDKSSGIQYDLKKMSKVINNSGKNGVGLGLSVFMFGYSLPEGKGITIADAKEIIEDRFKNEFLGRAKAEFKAFQINGHLSSFPISFCWDDEGVKHKEVWTAGAISIAKK